MCYVSFYIILITNHYKYKNSIKTNSNPFPRWNFQKANMPDLTKSEVSNIL